jgi:Domain of unknown function (DUF4252)
MKITTLVGLILLVTPTSALAQGARLQLDHLDRLSSQAAETVNLALDPAMLKLASAFLKADGDQAAVKEMLSEVSGIYVRSFEFDRDNAYSSDDVTTIRKQLSNPGWAKLVTIDSKRDRDSAEIYSWREGNESGGLAILVAEPRALTVVNIVGRIDLAKLAALQGNFGIPRLRIDPPPANR